MTSGRTGLLLLCLVIPAMSFGGGTDQHLDGSSIPTPAGFKDPLGYFSIDFPGYPERTTQTARVDGMDLPVVLFKQWHGGVLYSCAYTDYPFDASTPDKVDMVLDGAVENALLSSNGRLLTQEKVSRQGRPGRRLRVLGGDRTRKVHLISDVVIDHSRLYMYGVVCDPLDAYGNTVFSFLDSFRILRSPGTTGASSSLPSSQAGTGYTSYRIKGLGTIQVSDAMELQGGRFQELTRRYEAASGTKMLEEGDVIFQQPGVNDGLPSSRSTYVRLMLRTDVSERGDYDALDAPITMSQADLNELNTWRRQSLEAEYRSMANGMRLLGWDGLKVGRVGRYRALHFGYMRQLGSNPKVRVEEYLVPNGDRIHYITISYRVEDSGLWLPILERAL
ncbi:MAG: hypothetical protein KDC03_22610, partial [Flavobacteriales bacterium]|nr:hypothetical protein [Flavobacteriales bacterium]